MKEEIKNKLIKLLSDDINVIFVEFQQYEIEKKLHYKTGCVYDVIASTLNSVSKFSILDNNSMIELLDKHKIVNAYSHINSLKPVLQIYYLIRIEDLLNDFSFFDKFGITEEVLEVILRWIKPQNIKEIDYRKIHLTKFGVVENDNHYMKNGIAYYRSSPTCEWSCY